MDYASINLRIIGAFVYIVQFYIMVVGINQ